MTHHTKRRPERVVATASERGHMIVSLTLVGLLTAAIFAAAVLADLGSWFIR